MSTMNNAGVSNVQNAETQTEELPSCPSTGNIPAGGLARVETPIVAPIVTPIVALTLAITCNKVQRSTETQTDETRENEDICTYCGESKTGLLQEDNLFKQEFDKNCYRYALNKCCFCYEIFKNSADRQSHIAMCRQLSTICELCGYEVSCRKNLKKHKYEKHGSASRTYLCDICDRFCTSASELKFHLERIHGAEVHSERYCCELCCALFKQEINYHKHKRKHEMGQVKTVFQIENFRQEVNSEGSENSVVYVCPVCQVMFNDRSSLAIHLTDKKKLKCSTCRKLLYSEKTLFLHVCEQWTCQYCSKSFDQKVKWQVHERWHTGEKPIKCRKCDQTFRSWQGRRVHEEKHNRPSFQCAYCGKCFRTKYVFRDHVSCHEGKEFLCQICNKKFSGQKCLLKHFNAFHKDLKKVVSSNE